MESRMSRGITDKLRGSLEAYLERSAAELDERGAALAERADELAADLHELERREAEIQERRARLEQLGPVQQELDRTFAGLLADAGTRAAELAAEVAKAHG